MMTPILAATSLSWSPEENPDRQVLEGVTLSLEPGEFVTVMGPSGSGKTTLLHLLGGLEEPTKGTVLLGGVDLFAKGARGRTLLRRRFLGYVFQFFQLLPDLSVRENIVLPLLIAGKTPELHCQEIDEVVEVLGLGDLLDRQPHGLSGGEMQRVGIARALAQRPPILLCDEPTGNLSSKAGEETMQLFSRVRDRYGLSILLVTHNPRDAAFGDRVLFLRDGQLDPSHSLTGPGLDAAAVFSRLEELSI